MHTIQEYMKDERANGVVKQLNKHPRERFIVEDEFYASAATLRREFDSAIRTSASGGVTPFAYVFREGSYQLLSCSAERLLSPDSLSALIDRLATWAGHNIGPGRVSTPQARLFISGCSRQLLQDDIAASRHYLLSLTVNPQVGKRGELKVLLQEAEEERSGVVQTITTALPFNRLVVHATGSPYSIHLPKGNMDPIEGLLLLEGYMW